MDDENEITIQVWSVYLKLKGESETDEIYVINDGKLFLNLKKFDWSNEHLKNNMKKRYEDAIKDKKIRISKF